MNRTVDQLESAFRKSDTVREALEVIREYDLACEITEDADSVGVVHALEDGAILEGWPDAQYNNERNKEYFIVSERGGRTIYSTDVRYHEKTKKIKGEDDGF